MTAAATTTRAPATPARVAAPALVWAGAFISLVVAIVLYSRYGIGGNLSRDESIYAYGGQQLVDGVAPYASIFDPKTPLATMLAGLGVAGGRAVGANDLDAIRILFFAMSCLTVVAVYRLVVVIWRSPLAGVIAAVTFASFRGFAIDALAGPDAKTPGVLLGVVAMILLARKRWFWGGVAGALAFLVWQPFAAYVVVALLAAALGTPAGERRAAVLRAIGGAAIPVAATVVYFLVAGALHDFIQSAFVFPLTGVQRTPETVSQRISHVFSIVDGYYGHTRFLLWGGIALLLALALIRLVTTRMREGLADPLVCVVAASFVLLALYTATDFQGYPDVFPLLPYGAVGIGGTAAAVIAAAKRPMPRRVLSLAGAACAVILFGLTFYWYVNDHHPTGPSVAQQRAAADRVAAVAGNRTVYALGNPVPLVLLGRRNPSRYIYLSSGVGKWVVKHTKGGLAGWERDVRATHPAAIVVGDRNSNALLQLVERLAKVYPQGAVGHWTVFVDPALRDRAKQAGIAVS
jgi:hypothetical protein